MWFALALALPAAARGWSLDDHAAALQKELARALPECAVASASPGALTLTCPKQPYNIDGAGLYARCGGAKRACKEQVAALIDTLTLAVRPAPATLGTTVPVVRARSLAAAVVASGEPPLQQEPLVGDLVVVYVHDTPQAIRYLGEAELDALGVPDRQLREKLLPGAVSRAGAAEPVDLGHGAFVITGNPFVSSLVLAAEPWASLAAKGPLWIAIPEQGTLLYASGEAGHKALPGLTLEVYSRSKHPLSTEIYRWTPGGLVEAQP
jgi:hypothetical protein